VWSPAANLNMPRHPTITVTFRGEERYLADLCREHGMHWDTVQGRLRRGMPIEDALTKPTRYPKGRKKGSRRRERKAESAPAAARPMAEQERVPLHPLLGDAISILIDLREIILSEELTPRRLRLLGEIRSWLRRAGWR
jgi:hypothetical protein